MTMHCMVKSKSVIKKMLLGAHIPQLLARLGPPGVVILRYHSVQHEIEPFLASIGPLIHLASTFEEQMEMIGARFNPVTLDDVVQFLGRQKRMPRRAVAVTFDDGFADNCENAAPILERYGISATFYITVGAIGDARPPWFCRLRHAFHNTSKKQWQDSLTGGRWEITGNIEANEGFLTAARRCATLAGKRQDEALRSMEDDLGIEPLSPEAGIMMNWSQIRKLHRDGHIIGAHCVTHPNLAHVNVEDVQYEMRESKRVLEEQLGALVVHFSYPSPILRPHWTAQTVSLTKQIGFKTAVTCVPGPVREGHDLHSLRRISVPAQLDEFRWVLETTFAGHRP